MSICFCPLISGSSGNCIYIHDKNTHLLIDAGASGKTIEAHLRPFVHAADIDAIFISHEHVDHVQGAGVLSRRFDIPIYANQDTWLALERNRCFGKISEKNTRFFSYSDSVSIGALDIKPFATKHDAAASSGFNIYAGTKKISIATDLGIATDSVIGHIAESDILFLESNHDVEMLENGPYPWPLKRRIMSDFGHLSNVAAGDVLYKVFSKKLDHVYLGHLSAENNKPIVALETVTNILSAKGIEPNKHFSLHVANRSVNSFCARL